MLTGQLRVRRGEGLEAGGMAKLIKLCNLQRQSRSPSMPVRRLRVPTFGERDCKLCCYIVSVKVQFFCLPIGQNRVTCRSTKRHVRQPVRNETFIAGQ